jgi:hypothetical protein
VAQWQQLDQAYIRAALAGEVAQVEPAAGSTLVRAYAEAVGWVDTAADPLAPVWHIDTPERAPTTYGATGPAEDFAEALAMILIGRANWLDPDRVTWMTDWLGTTAEELSEGKPWSPAGSAEVISPSPVYDEELAASLARDRGAGHIEPLYFALANDTPDAGRLATQVAQALTGRRLTGSMDPVPDDRLPRFQGVFERTDGVVMLVELWDFRHAGGFVSQPDDAVLTYVVIW